VVALLVKLRGSDRETAWRSGLALAQGGEFCFALMAQMQQRPDDAMPGSALAARATFCSMLGHLVCCAPRLDCHTSAPQTQ
jgi:CPA2 family monovalent cation:H+ antiporter-2